MARLGLFGGTFDPIHMAHLLIAESAYYQFDLDKVIMMPAGIPPHKQGKSRASNEDRCNMLSLAIEDNPHLSMSYYEIEKEDTSYTYKTLEYLKEEYPDDEIFFIMGADSLIDFNAWMKPERICELAVILVAAREDMADDALNILIEERRSQYDADIRLLIKPDIELSSSQIREMAKDGRSIRYFVPDKVNDYIVKNHIYS